MNRAEFEFRGKQFRLVSPDTQMLNAGIIRFVTEGLARRLEKNIPGPVRRILDVGASIGHYTLLFHEIWPEAEIWAIEPSSRSFQYLMANTGHIPNVRHIPLAAGEATYTHALAMPSQAQKSWMNNPEGNCGIMSLYGDSDNLRENVPVVRLDDLIDSCDFIKIDTEGYEEKVILGAERLLRESRPALHVEFVRVNQEIAGGSLPKLADLVGSYGYVPTEVLHHDVIFLPREKVEAINALRG